MVLFNYHCHPVFFRSIYYNLLNAEFYMYVLGNMNCFEFDNAVEDKTFAKHSIHLYKRADRGYIVNLRNICMYIYFYVFFIPAHAHLLSPPHPTPPPPPPPQTTRLIRSTVSLQRAASAQYKLKHAFNAFNGNSINYKLKVIY